MATVKDIDKAIEEWERSLITAALEFREADGLVLKFPDDPGLRTNAETALKDYRNVRFALVRQLCY